MSKKILIFISILLILFSILFVESKGIKKLIYPKKYSFYVEKYSNEYDIDENLVYSVMKAESKFEKDVVSQKGAKGLMQISDITRNWAIEELDLGNIDIFDPETNIKIGCWYLNKLYKQFGDLDLVIAAYNGGSGNVRQWLNNDDYSENGRLLNIPFPETSNYVVKVKKYYEKYNMLYNEDGKTNEDKKTSSYSSSNVYDFSWM
ncbi:lytic transglycosylase domain-containing protein [Romboutsia sp. CE17]|uniref:lytic transglycosylase domain-containing protein n=1 Tax=Romboutsia sp. CE17 TaxID=2724150 RepID=UPI001442DE24|nr:lytic transglycosylase domain-containing protein [Romboutsia sp. CE17]QJA07934.1 lytic transglycosylase domain-containing protein [Romboutsia sp. CE17]